MRGRETFWLVHRTLLGVDLKLHFDDLLTYIAENLAPDLPLPLIDLVELGGEFPPEIELMEKPELPTK